MSDFKFAVLAGLGCAIGFAAFLGAMAFIGLYMLATFNAVA